MSKKIVITICGNSDASSFEMDLIKEKEKRSFPTPNVTANVNYDCACMRVCVCVCVCMPCIKTWIETRIVEFKRSLVKRSLSLC